LVFITGHQCKPDPVLMDNAVDVTVGNQIIGMLTRGITIYEISQIEEIGRIFHQILLMFLKIDVLMFFQLMKDPLSQFGPPLRCGRFDFEVVCSSISESLNTSCLSNASGKSFEMIEIAIPSRIPFRLN